MRVNNFFPISLVTACILISACDNLNIQQNTIEASTTSPVVLPSATSVPLATKLAPTMRSTSTPTFEPVDLPLRTFYEELSLLEPGQYIVYLVDYKDLVVKHIRNPDDILIEIPIGLSSIVFSPDLETIAVKNDDGYQIISLNTGETFPIDLPYPYLSLPAFSPNNDSLLFAASGNEYYPLSIYHLSTVDGTILQVTFSEAWEFSPSWSPDGRWIAYVSDEANITGAPEEYPTGTDIYILDAECLVQDSCEGVSTQITNFTERKNAFYLDWAPNSETIVFTCPQLSDVYELCVIDRDGDNLNILDLGLQGNKLSPNWSPDGKYIAFTYLDVPQSTEHNVFVLELDTMKVIQMTESQGIDEVILSWLIIN